MCLEAILGVLNACLPVLKPVFSKVQDSLKTISGRKGTSLSLKSGSIPICLRVSHMWQSRSGRRYGTEGLDSVISMEDLRRSESGTQPKSKAERLVGMKVFDIRVQRDFHVEIASGEDRISVLE